MIKRNNKKGFTIVELVIVIAVIAILAAVLIPTFAGIIKKANLSADEQAVRQMNTALAMYEAENGKPANLVEAKKALDEALVNVEGGLVPVTQGYAFYWDSVNNEIVLVGEGDTIENGWKLMTSNGFGTLVKVSDATALADAVKNSSNEVPALIKLDADVTLTEKITVADGNAAIIELNGKKLNAADDSYTTAADIERNCAIVVRQGGSLSIEGGELTLPTDAGRGIVNENGSLSLKDVKISASSEVAVYVDGFSDTSIVNCEIVSTNYYGIATNSSYGSSDGARVVIEDSKVSATYAPYFCSINANFVANNCTFTNTGSDGAAAVIKDGSHELNGCKLVAAANGANIYFVGGGSTKGYSGKLNANFADCEYYNGAAKADKAIVANGVLDAVATVTIDTEYTVDNKDTNKASTGSLTINGTKITLN